MCDGEDYSTDTGAVGLGGNIGSDDNDGDGNIGGIDEGGMVKIMALLKVQLVNWSFVNDDGDDDDINFGCTVVTCTYTSMTSSLP